MANDPIKQINSLVQCLSRDKKPIAFLLGAGCPYAIKDSKNSPLIPDIKGLTEYVKNGLEKKDVNIWNSIENQLKEESCENPSIEDILSRVRGLIEFAGIEGIQGIRKAVLISFEEKLSKLIVNCMKKDLTTDKTPFHQLSRWINSTTRSVPVEIYTTNYDLLIEQALEESKVPYFDGFIGSRMPFFNPYSIEHDQLPTSWARLWKLHGSINWRKKEVDEDILVWRTMSNNGGNVVIHPSHLKYDQSRKMPYLAMMDKLKQFLSIDDRALVITGYSFRDPHHYCPVKITQVEAQDLLPS